MQISQIHNKNEFSAIVINELKEFGVKHRKEKKAKIAQEKKCRQRVFRTHLQLLEATDVILANGSVVRIPKFVADACNRILEQVETEGIFRKAGSSIRQKEIRTSLEAGLPLGKSHHVIDVANVIKYFFRELPEPLIAPSMQETFLRSLLIGENYVKAVLLTCLLLPPLTINTLSFFMQFLRTVSLSDNLNKMSTENLAIIFTPGLMPFANLTSHRFTNHVKMVQLLIENANSIGTIPESIICKLHIREVLVPNTPSKSFDVVNSTQQQQKKKKKRRSEMFNGIRKIVGSAIGSSENLDNTTENKVAMSSNASDAHRKQQPLNVSPTPAFSTPCIKSSKKRKVIEPVCAFSAKKKRDLLGLLPSNSGGFLPNTPLIKESKKSRLSLGGNRHTKTVVLNPVVTSMERRWSIVGSGWSRSRNKNTVSNDIKSNNQSSEDNFVTEAERVHRRPSPVPALVEDNFGFVKNVPTKHYSELEGEGERSEGEFVQISKTEYQDIKERVAAIETRISQEFGTLSHSYADNLDKKGLSDLERVQNKYEQVMLETEALSSPATEQLAQRLSKGLKIRRSIDQRVIRSPSARKIGTIRRRSQERVRLSRNQTWHISSTFDNRAAQPAIELIQQPQPDIIPNSFYAKSNLKRGRPNTLHTGLLPQQYTPILEKLDVSCEQWTSGEVFFNDHKAHVTTKETDPHSGKEKPLVLQTNMDSIECTPIKFNRPMNAADINHTPMLPPKSVPRKHAVVKTPNFKMKLSSSANLAHEHRTAVSTPISDEVNGRESIARLRAQNAGMVMAKAKLFDGLGEGCASDNETPVTSNRTPSIHIGRRKSCLIKAPIHTSDPSEVGRVVLKENVPGKTAINENSSTLESQRMNKKNTIKSPRSIKKRQRLSVSGKYPYKPYHIEASKAKDALTQTCKLYGSPSIQNIKKMAETSTLNNNRVSPKTPKTRYHAVKNSPRRAHVTTKGYPNSPRFVKLKNGRNIAV